MVCGMEGREGSLRPRVLVIDDDDVVADLLRDVLSSEGYAVATAAHGAQALEMIRIHEPRLILADLRMPMMDGWAFLRQLRRDGERRMKVIIISALPRAAAEATALEADGFVAKPFELDELLRVVRRALEPGAG